MADMAGTPKKRRRSSGSHTPVAEVVTLDNVTQVHTQPIRKEVTLKGWVLATDNEVKKGQPGKAGVRRDVGGFILADGQALVQISLWGDIASKTFPQLISWLDEAEEATFPEVEVSAVQVGGHKVPCATELRRLMSTARTVVKRIGSGTPSITPAKQLLTETAAKMMQAPQTVCFQGVVTRVESVAHTQDDIALKEIGVTMKNGFEVPVMLYALQAEEEVNKDEGVVIWFGEAKAALRHREDSKGLVWVYNSGYVLNLGAMEPVGRGRPMLIGTSPGAVAPTPEDEESNTEE